MLDYASTTEQPVVLRERPDEVTIVLPPRTPAQAVIAQGEAALIAGVYLAAAALITFLVGFSTGLLGCSALLALVALAWCYEVWAGLRHRASQPRVLFSRGRLIIKDPCGNDLDVAYTRMGNLQVQRYQGFVRWLVVFQWPHTLVIGSGRDNRFLIGYTQQVLEATAHELETAIEAARSAGVVPAPNEFEVLKKPADGFTPPEFNWPAGVPRTKLRTDSEERLLREARAAYEENVSRLQTLHQRTRDAIPQKKR